MQRLQSLQVLMQREQQRCDQAQSALRRADDAARRAREQRDQLLAYRGEYQARWTAQFHQGGTMDILMYYRSFMQRLDQAVALQTRQAELGELQLAQARRELMESERRVASVRKLIERRAAELAHAGRQRDQKQTDEQAQRMRWPNTQRDRLLPQ
ncbi:MAG: flagellar export protein FliJ [Proteobacteria bacterium]|jgi:flagellar FliJ protein|nr:flagellar export protein FliJ [Pseudomonadota bacterium]